MIMTGITMSVLTVMKFNSFHGQNGHVIVIKFFSLHAHQTPEINSPSKPPVSISMMLILTII